MARPGLVLLCAAGMVVAACGGPESPKTAAALVPEADEVHAGLGEQHKKIAHNLVQRVLETLPSKQGLRWRGDDGVTITITALRTFKIQSGHFCRDYLQVVTFDSTETSTSKRACRDEGIWVPVPLDTETSL